MRTQQLKQSQVSTATLEWLMAKYKAVDSMNAELYRSFLAEDCELQFGNGPIVKCNNEIIGGIKHFWDTINGLDHSFINVLGNDTFIAAEAMIDYTRKDSQVVTIPCVTLIERNTEGLAKSVRIFIDVTPIYKVN
ncbi:MAG: nuclear transport factor 2 family protein [Chitinophagales bacterium]|nr:nuclear transport factor 2 family protein [Chitinophagales bacterium]